MRKKIIICIIACQTILACHSQKNDARTTELTNIDSRSVGVVGGTPATADQPIAHAVASIFVITRGSDGKVRAVPSQGSAVILSNKFLITSAHTFKGVKVGLETASDGSVLDHQIIIRYGVDVSRGQNFLVNVEDFSNPSVFSPNYSGPDYVFIRLPRGTPSDILPMGLSRTPSKYQPGQRLQIAGYGLFGPNKKDQLLLYTGEVTVTATDISQAKFTVPYQFRQLGTWFTDHFLETDETGPTSFCTGDSGGPLFYDNSHDNMTRLSLVGIHMGQGVDKVGFCKNSGYAVRVDSFFDAAIEYDRRLN